LLSLHAEHHRKKNCSSSACADSLEPALCQAACSSARNPAAALPIIGPGHPFAVNDHREATTSHDQEPDDSRPVYPLEITTYRIR